MNCRDHQVPLNSSASTIGYHACPQTAIFGQVKGDALMTKCKSCASSGTVHFFISFPSSPTFACSHFSSSSYTVILTLFPQRKNDGEDVLLREFDWYVVVSCWHRNYVELSLKERRESTRPCDVCDGMDMVMEGEKLLKQPLRRQSVLVNTHN